MDQEDKQHHCMVDRLGKSVQTCKDASFGLLGDSPEKGCSIMREVNESSYSLHHASNKLRGMYKKLKCELVVGTNN